MKNTFDKAKVKQAKAEKRKEKKWYQVERKLSYADMTVKVNIFLLPLFLLAEQIEKFNSWRYNRLEWSEEKATELLDRTLPKVVEYVEEDNAYYFCMSWNSWYLKNKAPLHLRKWAMKFNYKVIPFIKEGYENSNYIKTVEDDGYDTWVKFTPINYINGKKDNQIVVGERLKEMDKNIPEI